MWRAPPGQEGPAPERRSGSFPNLPGRKGALGELGRIPGGRGCLRLPGALTEEVRPGGEGATHRRQLPKGLQRARGAPGAAPAVAPRGGGCAAPGAIPAAQARGRCAGDTAQDPALPPGQAEAGRTQGGEDAPAAPRPRAVQGGDPGPGPGLGDGGRPCGERPPGLESWPPPGLFLLCHLVPGMKWGHQGAGASQDKQLTLSRAPGSGQAAPPGAHT